MNISISHLFFFFGVGEWWCLFKMRKEEKLLPSAAWCLPGPEFYHLSGFAYVPGGHGAWHVADEAMVQLPGRLLTPFLSLPHQHSGFSLL